MRLLISGVQSFEPHVGCGAYFKRMCTFLGSIARASGIAGLGRSPRICILEKRANDCEVDRACDPSVPGTHQTACTGEAPTLHAHILLSSCLGSTRSKVFFGTLESPPQSAASCRSHHVVSF